MFKIKTGCYLKLLTSETMKLLGSTKIKISKNKNSENVPYLKITEVVYLLTRIINKIQESYIHLSLLNHLINY